MAKSLHIFDVLKYGTIVAHDNSSLIVTHDGRSGFDAWELDEEGTGWIKTNSFTDQTAYKNFERALVIGRNYVRDNCGYGRDYDAD